MILSLGNLYSTGWSMIPSETGFECAFIQKEMLVNPFAFLKV